MSASKLTSIRIQNFRVFRDLMVDSLGRVNLIVGKNNVGKTSLLEAVHLYVSYDTSRVLNDIVNGRDLRDLDASRRRETSEYGVHVPPERHLIHGRPSLDMAARGDSWDDLPGVEISSTPDQNQPLSVYLHLPEKSRSAYADVLVGEDRGQASVFGQERVRSVFVSAMTGESRVQVEEIWDRVELTPREENVLDALRIIEPDLLDVRLRDRSPSGENSKGTSKRIALVRVKDSEEPESLRSLGAGMNRLFEIALALIDAENGVLLIDEIENGLHHSIHPKVWRLIFETAQKLDIQVFATTHSYDALRAFEHVANEYPDDESVLVQLRRRRSEPGDVVAVTAGEDELTEALEFNIDPR